MEAHGSYRNQVCSKQKTWTSNLLNTEDQWVPFAVVMEFLPSQNQKVEKISKVRRRAVQMGHEGRTDGLRAPHEWTSKAAYDLRVASWEPHAKIDRSAYYCRAIINSFRKSVRLHNEFGPHQVIHNWCLASDQATFWRLWAFSLCED